MIGEGEACALWAGCVCAEGGAGTWTRRQLQEFSRKENNQGGEHRKCRGLLNLTETASCNWSHEFNGIRGGTSVGTSLDRQLGQRTNVWIFSLTGAVTYVCPSRPN